MTTIGRYSLTAALVMPQPTLEEVTVVHERIFRLSQSCPGSVFGVASVDPWLDETAYREEAEKCLSDYRFVAIKLHPLGHNISPLSPLCEKVYQVAAEYGVPVIVHTGLGTPHSLPALMIDPAKRYPEVTFILAHAGFAVYSTEAIVAAKYCPNLILEPSWCPTFMVRGMIDQIGSDRVIMGSDHLNNLPVELAKYNAIGLSERQFRDIMFDNPNRIFNLRLEKT